MFGKNQGDVCLDEAQKMLTGALLTIIPKQKSIISFEFFFCEIQVK